MQTFKLVLAHVLKCFPNVHDRFRETVVQDRELYAFVSVDEYLLKILTEDENKLGFFNS